MCHLLGKKYCFKNNLNKKIKALLLLKKNKKETIYVYIWQIHFVVQQELTQYCKATICQLKKKKTFLLDRLGVQCSLYSDVSRRLPHKYLTMATILMIHFLFLLVKISLTFFGSSKKILVN